jgi:hypothetical protein
MMSTYKQKEQQKDFNYKNGLHKNYYLKLIIMVLIT